MKNLTWYEKLNKLVTSGVFPDVVHRVLLYGPPGTGKSSWALEGFGLDNVEAVTVHRGMGPEDLLWQRDLQNGSTGWILGPAVRAMKEGKGLILDEIDQLSAELRCAVNAIMNAKRIAQLTLPDGTVIRPAPGFFVVCTTNVDPSAIPATIQDRLDIILCADIPADGAMRELPVGARVVAMNHYAGAAGKFNWQGAPISYRALLTASSLAKKISPAEAYALVFGAKGADILTSISANS